MIQIYLRILLYLLRKNGKISFIKALNKNAVLLDVGCGNNSPIISKMLRSDIHYVGIDIGDYNQNKNPNDIADEYILTTPELFSNTIANLQNRFDAVISSHNLEHCNAPNSVLHAMFMALKPGGRIYLSFPSEASVSFPKKRGLNYFDDSTHKEVPQLNNVLELIKSNGFQIDFIAVRYRPRLLAFIGLVLEPLSIVCGKLMIGTWELYGFESIIWATKMTSTPLVEKK